jgi:branched-chain amino acid aminotransferase
MKVWYNDSLIDAAQAPLDNGWLRGEGIFETIRTIAGQPLALSRHMRRALKSGFEYGITIPSQERTLDALEQVIAAQQFDNGRLRISFSDSGDWLVTHDDYVEVLTPATLGIAQARIDSQITPPKRFPYSYRLDILEQAQQAGFDDAIVCNSKNHVCESSISNLLLYLDGAWITPPLSDGLLAGVTRALVIEELSIKVRTLRLDELKSVTGAILLSSLKIAQPVAMINSRKMQELPISQSLSAQIRAMVIASSIR